MSHCFLWYIWWKSIFGCAHSIILIYSNKFGAKEQVTKKKQKPKSSHTAEYVAIEIWWEAPSYNRTLPIYSSRCQNLRELYDMTLNVNYITKQKLWVKCTAVYYMKIFAKRMEERQRYNLLFWNSTTFHSSSLVCGAQVYRQNENAVGF